MGHEWLQRPRRAILGSYHGYCSNDAPGAQELCHLRCSESNRHTLRHWKRGQQSADLELSEPEVVLRPTAPSKLTPSYLGGCIERFWLRWLCLVGGSFSDGRFCFVVVLLHHISGQYANGISGHFDLMEVELPLIKLSSGGNGRREGKW